MAKPPITPAEAAKAAALARKYAAQYPSPALTAAAARAAAMQANATSAETRARATEALATATAAQVRATEGVAALSPEQLQGIRAALNVILEIHRQTEVMARNMLPAVQAMMPVVESVRRTLLASDAFMQRNQAALKVLAGVMIVSAEAERRRTAYTAGEVEEKAQEWIEQLVDEPQFVTLAEDAATEVTDDEIRAEVAALGLSEEDWIDLDIRQLRLYVAFLTVIYVLIQYIEHPMLKQAINEVTSVAGWAGWLFTAVARKRDK